VKTITWHLEGCAIKTVSGKGRHEQDAFTRMTREARQQITMYCTHVTSN